MTIVMRNGRDFLMKELKKSSSRSNPHSSSHPRSDNNSIPHNSSHPHNDSSSNSHSNNHPRNDSSSSSKKDSMIWTIQEDTVHLEVKTNLQKVGRKIIS
jgi:hypothetical protein